MQDRRWRISIRRHVAACAQARERRIYVRLPNHDLTYGLQQLFCPSRLDCKSPYSDAQAFSYIGLARISREHDHVGASADEHDPWRRLRLGFERLIDFCAAPDVQRITFIEAPQVIGPEAWRKIELRYAFGAVRGVLTALRDAGVIKPYPTDLVARILLALLHETSAELARSKRDPVVRAQIADLVAGVFDTLAV